MIKSVNQLPISQVFDIESSIIYAVPKYQREYTWNRPRWEDLFDDITENDAGYFLGSIICINQTKSSHDIQKLEIIDGQQRLTTISLLFAALYDTLGELSDMDDEEKLELLNLKRKLVLKNKPNEFRVVPQYQNNNFHDYRAILSELNIIDKFDRIANAGNRRIYKAFRFFKERIKNDLDKLDNKTKYVFSLLEKINKSVIVLIEVDTYTDAYTLFETLNNRGTPLTAIDLIKNVLLAKLVNTDNDKMDYYFDIWNKLLRYLGDDYNVQERFFRQYYNAFKNKLNEPFREDNKKKDPLGSVATRTNLLNIFEALIKHDSKKFLDDIVECGKLYSIIINNDNNENAFSDVFNNLERIQGAPSYLFILFLLKNQTDLLLDNSHITEIVNILTKFFVKRNLTNIPSTYELTRLFMSLIDDIEDKKGNEIVDFVRSKIISVSASDLEFENKLRNSIYEDNYGVTRFILCSLAQDGMTKETFIDLWKMSGKNSVWTVEHIFPQGENIPEHWVGMIANGNKETAKKYQDEYVHTIGNLTITGYNSSLGNKCFEDKRDRMDKNGHYVGYKNGLPLNEDLKNETQWTVEKIKNRTDKLVSHAIRIFEI